MPTKSHSQSPSTWTPRPGDATLTVTRAAQVLGVHANTVRAWSEAGRLRYYRINERGDRRYRLGDLQRFLAAAESTVSAGAPDGGPSRGDPARPVLHPDRDVRRPGPAGRPRGGRLVPDRSRPRARRGVPPDPHRDRRGPRRDLGAAAGRPRRPRHRRGGDRGRTPQHPAGVRACSRGRSRAPSRSMRGPGDPSALPVLGMGTDELLVAIPGGEAPWGLLAIAGAMELGPDDGRRLATAIARTLGVLVRGAGAAEQATSRLRRSEALRRVATDLASRLDVADVVRDLCDHARVLFGADRVAVILRDAEGRVSSPGGTGFSEAFLAAARELEHARAGVRDLPSRRPVRAPWPGRPAVVQPGPSGRHPGGRREPAGGPARRRPGPPRRLLPGPQPTPPLARGWTSTPPRRSRATRRSPSDPRAPSAGWPPGRPSSSRSSALGARLAGITDVHDIGIAIATELRQLITYDNARVYRIHGSELLPVAFQGQGARLRSGDTRGALGGGRRGDHRLGRPVQGPAARGRQRPRPARRHDPRHGRRAGRVDAPRADGPRGRLPRCRRAREAGPAPVHRGRPSAAGHLRILRGPGHGQRRRHVPAARAVAARWSASCGHSASSCGPRSPSSPRWTSVPSWSRSRTASGR